jgi:hypothetical protein
MKSNFVSRSRRTIVILIVILITAGCGNIPATVNEPTPSSVPVAPTLPSPAATEIASPQPEVPVPDGNALYQDDFTDPATSWPSDKFDNYFIGYHEPEYYHIEITAANYKTAVFEPRKQSFGDFTLELQVLTVSAKTAPEGDFRYGLAFRRSGDQYYAFTISPRTKKWFVLKSSPNQLTVLTEGTDPSIHDLDTDDTLRVDAQGSDFFFHINDHLVGQVSDSDYAAGEIGFYAESLDVPNVHVHFDTLTIRDFEAPTPQEEVPVLYEDDFTNPTTGWTERKFDNYFIGYHEPEYYHVEITTANYKTTVFEPEKESLSDFTTELQVLAVSAKTAPEGDFRYGLAFRRSGDQYYAFTISPRTKKWFVLKSSPSGLETLQEGMEESIHDLDEDDLLRVDAQGPNFLFHLNDRLLTQVTDSDYTSGETGFYVENFDAPNTHIHFDKLTIRDLTLSLMCNVHGGSVYLRSGPGKTHSQIALLSNGDSVEALGISPNRWVKIIVKGMETPGWVSYSEGYMSCTPTVDLFPIVSP